MYPQALAACLLALQAAASTEPASNETSSNGTDTQFIVGGWYTNEAQFPSTVYLTIDFNFGHFSCGGVILHPSWVATAAHCCMTPQGAPAGPYSVTVTAGARDLRNGGVRVRSAGVTVHNGYRVGPVSTSDGPMYINDIAVIRMSQPLPQNYYIGPAALQRQAPGEYSVVTVAGWGRTSPTDPRSTSPVLKFTNLYVLSNARCANQIFHTILNEQLCTVEAPSHTCQGDSGSPVYLNGRAVGLVSWGGVPCGQGPSVYTNLPYYINWLRQNTGLYNL